MIKDTGGPAFPVAEQYDERAGGYVSRASDGMTLRDYFAAKAMGGLFDFWVAVNAKTSINDPDAKIIAEMAYEYADAMLAERSKP